jgi:hypothetical protein
MTTAAQNANPMRTRFRLLTARVLRLALPAISAPSLISGKHMPSRMATHFDWSGQPNGWMLRQWALGFFLLAGSAQDRFLGSRPSRAHGS